VTTQNVTAVVVIMSTVTACIAYGKWEVLAALAGAATLYLFPKKQ
jgi:hypothetical protein